MSNGPPSRDRRSLQDLAKLASSPSLSPSSSRTLPPPSSRTAAPPSSARTSSPEHDSGIVDLKIIAQGDEAGAERAKTTPLASAGLFDDEVPSVAPPRPSVHPSDPPPSGKVPSTRPGQAAQVAPISKAPGAAKAALAASPAPPEGGGMLVPVLAGLGIAAAATVIFMVTRPAGRAPKAPSVGVAVAETPSLPPATAAVEKTAPPATPAPAANPPTAAATPEPPAANETPKVASPVGARHLPGPIVRKAAENAGGGSSVSELSAMMAHATNSPPAPAPASAGNLGEAVQNAAGGAPASPAGEAPPPPAAPQFAPGSVPEKPSQGAVTSALSQALPAARSCLNPDDPISKANVTFSSAGSVSAVVVTGSAAGKPAEACIKSALMKAAVPPFAQATYSANVTVRPN